MNKRNSSDFGIEAEKLAAEYLIRESYTIRERNWRPKNSHLEIDIIAQKDDEIIFVEVKARNGMWQDPAEAIDNSKINKLVRGANSYLRSLEHDFFYRFDVITVVESENGLEIDHLEDAFLPPLTTR